MFPLPYFRSIYFFVSITALVSCTFRTFISLDCIHAIMFNEPASMIVIPSSASRFAQIERTAQSHESLPRTSPRKDQMRESSLCEILSCERFNFNSFAQLFKMIPTAPRQVRVPSLIVSSSYLHCLVACTGRRSSFPLPQGLFKSPSSS